MKTHLNPDDNFDCDDCNRTFNVSQLRRTNLSRCVKCHELSGVQALPEVSPVESLLPKKRTLEEVSTESESLVDDGLDDDNEEEDEE